MLRLPVLLMALVLALPAMAQEGRSYACTNMMGGNPFRLVLGADFYRVETLPQSTETLSGEGKVMRDQGVAIHVTSGPLLKTWKVDSIIEMSSNNLVLSGDEGLRDCEKSK